MSPDGGRSVLFANPGVFPEEEEAALAAEIAGDSLESPRSTTTHRTDAQANAEMRRASFGDLASILRAKAGPRALVVVIGSDVYAHDVIVVGVNRAGE